MSLPTSSWAKDLTPQEQGVFVRDELLDVVIENVGRSQWQALLDYVTQRYDVSFIVSGQNQEVPEKADELLDRPLIAPFGLRIRVGNLSINEYFLNESAIDFDMKPAEIESAADVADFLSFVLALGEVLEREVVVRVEGSQDERGVVLRFMPGDEGPTYIGVGSAAEPQG